MKDFTQKPNQDIVIAFVGAIVPEDTAFQTPAFSRAGQIYQKELLQGLKSAGLHISEIISIIPIPAFPKSKRIWVPSRQDEIIPGIPTRLLPFLNIFLLKQLFIGVFTMLALIRWGSRNKSASKRVVYAYNLTVPPGLFTLIGANCIGAKSVVSLCDIDVPGNTVPRSMMWRFNFWLQRKLIPLFDGHVVACDAIARDFLPNRPYLRLDGGMTQQFASDLRSTESRKLESRSVFVIGFAGRLDETNGIPTILEAFSQLHGDTFRLFLAGAGPLEMLVKQAASKDSRIIYKGLLTTADVIRMYVECDLLVNMRPTQRLNTRYFFPSKLLEYMASATPVITTCVGHTEEEFGQFVYLLRDETPKGLAAAFRRIAELPRQDRERLGRIAQEHMVSHKTWHAQAKMAAEFIRDVAFGQSESSACMSEVVGQQGVRRP